MKLSYFFSMQCERHTKSTNVRKALTVGRLPLYIVCVPQLLACLRKIELSLRSRTLFVDNFPRSWPATVETHGNTDPPLATPGATHTCKNRDSPTSMRSPTNSHAPGLLLTAIYCFTSQPLHDVVDMMMSLTLT